MKFYKDGGDGLKLLSTTPQTSIKLLDDAEEMFKLVQLGDYKVMTPILGYTNLEVGKDSWSVDLVIDHQEAEEELLRYFSCHFSFHF